MSEDIHRCVVDNVVVFICFKSFIFLSAHIEHRRKSFAFQTIEVRGQTHSAGSLWCHRLGHWSDVIS